jgi:ABC-type transport system involved in cytochrome bd biosynthesis fused ATPase/permease subunit
MRKYFKKFCGKILGFSSVFLVLYACIFYGQSYVGLVMVLIAAFLIVVGFILDVCVFKNIKRFFN